MDASGTGYQFNRASGRYESTAVGGTDNASVPGGEVLDTPNKVRAYIDQRKHDLPPVTASLEQLVQEVTERGGVIALATLLRGDFVAKVHVPCREVRQRKNVIRQRLWLARLRTMIRNRIQGSLKLQEARTTAQRS